MLAEDTIIGCLKWAIVGISATWRAAAVSIDCMAAAL
jgi:hypothetical protein